MLCWFCLVRVGDVLVLSGSGQVSTNAAEGLFGRVKKFYRAREKTKLNQDSYGGLLAEHLWRLARLLTAVPAAPGQGGVLAGGQALDMYYVLRSVSLISLPAYIV